jgi:hypothetical protein
MPARRRVIILALVCLAPLGGGCGSRKLETGYQYTPLDATPVQRRAYYAGAFSPEARDAMMSREGEAEGNVGRRPTGGPR